jgi:hypothetical protein
LSPDLSPPKDRDQASARRIQKRWNGEDFGEHLNRGRKSLGGRGKKNILKKLEIFPCFFGGEILY